MKKNVEKIIELLLSKDSESVLLGIKMIPFVKFYRYIKENKPKNYKLVLLLMRNRNYLEFIWHPFHNYYLIRMNKSGWCSFPIGAPYLVQLYQKFENENLGTT